MCIISNMSTYDALFEKNDNIFANKRNIGNR